MSSDWGLGDIVTATFSGVWADCKVEEVSIHAAEGSPVYETRAKFRVLSITPELVDIVIAGGQTLANADGAATFRSIDNGKTWTESTVWSVNLNSTLALLEAENGDLFAAVGTGTGGKLGEVWRSRNRGLSWTRVFQHATERLCYSLVQAENGDILMGTGTTGEFWRSQDGGENWAKVGQTAANRSIASMAKASEGSLVAGCSIGGIGSGEIYRSVDNGATWALAQVLAPGNNAGVGALICLANGTLLAGTGSFNGHIWQSQDNGATWNDLSRLPTEERCNCLVQDADGVVYAGSANECKVFRSYDGGATWLASDRLSLSGTNVYSLAVLSNGNILAGTDCDDGVADVAFVYRSEDHGLSWSYLSQIEGDSEDIVRRMLVLAEEA